MVARLLLVYFCLSLAAAAQDQKPPYSKPPKLKHLFADDFQEDSRGDYEISGRKDAVKWEKGKLTIGDGAILHRQLVAGSWVEMEIDFEFPKLTKDGQTSELKVWLNFADATDSFVWFRQKREQGKTRSAIFIVDTNGNWNGKPRQQLKSQPWVRTKPITNGRWRISYRYGLWTIIEPGNRQPLVAFIQNGSAEVNQAIFESINSAVTLHETDAKIVKRVDWKPDNLARKEVAQAKLLSAGAMQSYKSKNLADAIRKTQAVEKTFERTLGRYHPDYATSLHSLAFFYESIRDFDKAVPLYLDAIDIREEVLGKTHRDYLSSLNYLATAYVSNGSLHKAEPLNLEVSESLRQIYGAANPIYAGSLANLGGVYEAMRESDKALRILLKANKIFENSTQKGNLDHAVIMNNLAIAYRSNGDNKRAQSLFFEVKRIQDTSIGKKSPQYANTLNNLAVTSAALGELAKAEKLYLESLKISEREYGKEHPEYARPLNNLASLYSEMGNVEKASKLYRESLRIREKTLGQRSLEVGASLNNLASVLTSSGDYESAEPYYLRSLDTSRKIIGSFSSVQSEKQHREFAGSFDLLFSKFVSNSLHLPDREKLVFDQALNWKGVSLVRQKQTMRLSQYPDFRRNLDLLLNVKSQYSKHLRSNPNAANWSQNRERLGGCIEKLEKTISALAGQLNIDSVGVLPDSLTLPKKACLVDFRRFRYSEPDARNPGEYLFTPHYLGLVLEDNGSVKMHDLGPTSPIDAAIAIWRKPMEISGQDDVSNNRNNQIRSEQAGQELRQLIWDPLAESLKETELVIISPDGALGRLPLIALPGMKPGSFLLEEKRIVYFPVPSLLHHMLGGQPRLIGPSTSPLIVGNIDYGETSKPEELELFAYRNHKILKDISFAALPGTIGEMNGINTLFEKATLLSGSNATEQAFQERVKNHSVLHVATHGFFQSPDGFIKSLSQLGQGTIGPAREQAQVLNMNPNLLSGLAFAQANKSGTKTIDEGGNDGILYSAEIAMLPLEHVELAVLSACETSLGTDDNPGEGLIGIQRAFQVAGAKSTIASYWKVDDRATQLLMNKFYENLLEYSKKKDPEKLNANLTTIRIDALRDAQLWMLNNQIIASTTNRGEPIEVDPKKIKKAEKTINPADKNQRTHPRYWAAFMLSGDWR